MRRLFSLALTVVCFLLVVVDLARIAQAQNAIFRGSRDVLLMVQMKVDHKGTIATATATKRSNESRKDAASALAAAGVDGAVAHYVAYADLDDTSAESTLQRALDAAPLPANGRVPGRVAHYIAFGDPNDPVVRALAKKFGLPVRESREAVKASDAQKPLRVSGLSEEDIKKLVAIELQTSKVPIVTDEKEQAQLLRSPTRDTVVLLLSIEMSDPLPTGLGRGTVVAYSARLRALQLVVLNHNPVIETVADTWEYPGLTGFSVERSGDPKYEEAARSNVQNNVVTFARAFAKDFLKANE